MFLFLIASGLSLIFGVLRVLNFAHGTFYMLGAYLAYQSMLWLGPGPGRFWIAALGAGLGIALLGGIVERVLFRYLYGKTVKDPEYPFAIMKPVTYVDPSKFMD